MYGHLKRVCTESRLWGKKSLAALGEIEPASPMCRSDALLTELHPHTPIHTRALSGYAHPSIRRWREVNILSLVWARTVTLIAIDLCCCETESLFGQCVVSRQRRFLPLFMNSDLACASWSQCKSNCKCGHELQARKQINNINQSINQSTNQSVNQ